MVGYFLKEKPVSNRRIDAILLLQMRPLEPVSHYGGIQAYRQRSCSKHGSSRTAQLKKLAATNRRVDRLFRFIKHLVSPFLRVAVRPNLTSSIAPTHLGPSILESAPSRYCKKFFCK